MFSFSPAARRVKSLHVQRPRPVVPPSLAPLLALLAGQNIKVTVHVHIGRRRKKAAEGAGGAPAPAGPAVPPDEPMAMHDFRRVYWPGLGWFWLTPMQSRAVRRLWEAWRSGEVDVGQAELLRASGSDGVRLADLFRDSPAWNVLVVSTRRGYYRLPPTPDEENRAVTLSGRARPLPSGKTPAPAPSAE